MNLIKKIRNENGASLIFVYLIIAVLVPIAVTFYSVTISELHLVERQRMSIQSISIAEAGLERTIYELRKDFENDTAGPSWSDGDINGMICGPDVVNFYTLPLSNTNMGNGSFNVTLKNVAGTNDEIWVRAAGMVGDVTKIIQAYIRIRNFSLWDHVIFAGNGAASDTVINGNVDIRGSVHLLGANIDPTDFAMDMSGSGNIGNNYEGMPVVLKNKIPSCPATLFNGELVESLSTEVRVKRGLVGLSGTAALGKIDQSGNVYKETVDGVYVSDGYGGNQGENNVYSDNGTKYKYDLGGRIQFPSLSSPYGGYPSYQEYLRNNALVISDPAQLNNLANIRPNSNFNYSGADGSISMDGSGNLVVNGIVYIDGGNLGMNKSGPNKTINYTGRGTIFTTGNASINVNLYTQGNSSFPNNIIGVMTPNTINFNEANTDVMGLFYAEDDIIAQKQVDVVGAFASNFFDMGTNVPSIFQVPSVIDNLPPGLIGTEPIWIIKVVSWQKL